MDLWLILPHTLKAIAAAMKNPQLVAQQVEFDARLANSAENPALNIAGSTAEIRIQGALTARPSFFAMYFGGGNTTYPDIINGINAAEQDDSIDEIILDIDSPGGSINGMFEAMEAIANANKPTRAVIRGMAASAAYGLASQADTIEATGEQSQIGSVGIVASIMVSDDVVEITSSNAPNKRPDVTTEAGKSVVRAELDEIEDLFSGRIATGRGTTLEKVNADFGRGGTMLAGNALKRGMIDSIIAGKSTTASTGGDKQGAKPMNLAELKAKHPDVYAQAAAEGEQKGREAEKDRVTAHIVLGKQAGALDVAVEAIEAGADMSATYQAKYLAAGMNKQAADAAASDSEAAAAATGADGGGAEGQQAAATADSAADDIFQQAATQCGVKLGA